MPIQLKQLSREAYCSAPPIPSSSLCPPRLTREREQCRPHAPLRKPQAEFFVKGEVSSESVEDVECKSDVKFEPRIPFDPRQRSDQLQAGLAALAIRPSSSASSADEKTPTAPGPSRYAKPWGICGEQLCHVPVGPKGSKSRSRVAFTVATLPERPEKLKVEERLAKMASK